MKKPSPARLCYALLLACVFASMVCAFWVPNTPRPYLSEHHPGVLRFISSIYPQFPGWSQYFCVQTLAALIAICATAHVVSGGAEWLRLRRRDWRLIFPCLVGTYALWASASWLWSAWPFGTRGYVIRELPFYFLCVVATFALREERRWLTFAGVFLAAAFVQAALQALSLIDTIHTDDKLRGMLAECDTSRLPAAWLVAGGALVALIALAWVFVRRARSRRDAGLAPFLGALCAAGLALASVAAGVLSAYFVPLNAAFRKRAVYYSNPNFGSAVMLTASLICIGLILRGVHGLRRNSGGANGAALRSPARSLGVALTCVLALALFAFLLWTAHSLAGAVAAVAAAVAYLVLFLPARKKHLVVGGLILLMICSGLVVLGSGRLRKKACRWALSPSSTAHLRVIDGLAAWRLFAKRPVVGWGMGTWPAIYSRAAPPLATRLPFTRDIRPTHPHNEFVRVTTELGTAGLLLYLGVLAFAFTVSYAALRDKALKLRLVGHALWAGALAFVVQGAFGKAPMDWSFGTNFWILLGVMASASLWSGQAPPAAPQSGAAKVPPSGWAVVAIITALVAWAWWTWAVGSYRSMVTFRHANYAQRQMRFPAVAWESFGAFRKYSNQMRTRSLWPDEAIHHDYAMGWFLTGHREWASAAEQLEKLQQTAPELLKTRLFLAECHLGMGRTLQAVDHLEQFLRRNPYNVEAYRLLARIIPQAAIDGLEQHVISRLTDQEGQIVRDYPTPEEVQTLVDFYVRAGQWQRAKAFAERAESFDAGARPRDRVNVRGQLRRLASTYAGSGQSELARQVGAVFPKAFQDGKDD